MGNTIETCTSCGNTTTQARVIRFAYGLGKYTETGGSRQYGILMAGKRRDVYCPSCFRKTRKESWKYGKRGRFFLLFLSILLLLGGLALFFFVEKNTLFFFAVIGGIACTYFNWVSLFKEIPTKYAVAKYYKIVPKGDASYNRYAYRIFDTDMQLESYELTQLDLPRWVID